jgi:hypothetical protein
MQHQAYSAEMVEAYEPDHIEHLLEGEDEYAFTGSDIDALSATSVVPDAGTHSGIDTDSINNDDAEDADVDTDDFDAESAVIDEFIQDGGLTPTATITASNAGS